MLDDERVRSSVILHLGKRMPDVMLVDVFELLWGFAGHGNSGFGVSDNLIDLDSKSLTAKDAKHTRKIGDKCSCDDPDITSPIVKSRTRYLLTFPPYFFVSSSLGGKVFEESRLTGKVRF